MQELWRETSDDRFYRINCLFRPWEDERSALIGHLAENDLHGSLTFIEKAVAIVKAKELYEPDGSSLSLRELSARLKADGYPISTSHLSRMLDCVNSLLPAIPQILYGGLGKPQIEKLLSLKSSLEKIYNKYLEGSPEDFKDFWITTLAPFDVIQEAFELTRVQDELLGRLSMLTGQDYPMLEIDLSEFYSDRAATAKRAIPVTPPVYIQNQDTVAVSAEEKPEYATSPASEPGSAVADSLPHDPDQSRVQTTDTVPERVIPESATEHPSINQVMTEDEQQKRIDAHVVEPVTTTPRVQRIKEQVEASYGKTLPDFNECAVTAIPVQAGGLANVSDVWYIEEHINNPESLREQIFLLAYEIAAYGGSQEQLIKTAEGLGFGIDGALKTDTPQSTGIALLLTSILRLHNDLPAHEQTQLPAALFGQILIGTAGIQIGASLPEDMGLERLPDLLLVKLFRLIRLARRLVDLIVV